MLEVEFLQINEYQEYLASWSVLTVDEQVRSRSFRMAQDRMRFQLGRLMVRKRLSQELNLEPDKVPICQSRLGQPRCLLDGASQFSITHAGSWVAVGWSDAPVGVDIEPLSSVLDTGTDIHMLNAPEMETFNTLDCDPIHHRLKLFVAKEAALKCLGLGFSVDPRMLKLSEFVRPWHIIAGYYQNTILFVRLENYPSGYLLGVASQSLDRLAQAKIG